MLPIKKIYIDSRNRTPDSASSSNFKIELDRTIQLPDNTVFFITDICIPHVFQLIEQGVNDKLYYQYVAPNPHNSASISTFAGIITLSPGGYTGNFNINGTTISGGAYLANQIQTSLNNNVDPAASISFTASWDATQYSINVSCSGDHRSFRFLNEEQIQLYSFNWRLTNFDPANTQSANDIFKIDTPQNFSQNFVSDFIQLQPINNVYITSPNLGSFDTIASFSNNVVKKVPVTVPYGYMIIDQTGTNNDFLNCSRQTHKTIEFHLKDSRGRYINLHGMNVSFSIVFNKFDMN